MGGVHGEGNPLTLGVDDRTQWVIDRIVDLHPSNEPHNFVPPIAVRALEEALAALQGRAGCTLFGLSSMAIAVERHREVLALVEDTLAAWREWALRTDHAWFSTSDKG